MSEFDRDCITYTQEGRILQIQYASKAVENGETIVGVKCKDGIVLAAEKLIFSKLLVQGTHKRVFNVDRHLGMVVNGKIPDGRHIMNYARNQSQKFMKDFDIRIGGRTLANRLSLYLNAYTLYNSVRPFGSSEILASWSGDEGYNMYMLEPSGSYYGYSCCTSGKGRQVAKAEFEKTDFSKLTCRQALFYIAKIMIQSHEQSREKKWEFEMSWICEETDHVFKGVSANLVDEAVAKATAAIEEEEMGDE